EWRLDRGRHATGRRGWIRLLAGGPVAARARCQGRQALARGRAWSDVADGGDLRRADPADARPGQRRVLAGLSRRAAPGGRVSPRARRRPELGSPLREGRTARRRGWARYRTRAARELAARQGRA